MTWLFFYTQVMIFFFEFIIVEKIYRILYLCIRLKKSLCHSYSLSHTYIHLNTSCNTISDVAYDLILSSAFPPECNSPLWCFASGHTVCTTWLYHQCLCVGLHGVCTLPIYWAFTKLYTYHTHTCLCICCSSLRSHFVRIEVWQV